jgi:pimeloyl-ACP methyl ester carboxylesterase
MAGVRFFVGSRGRRLAYTDDGEGPALVCPPKWICHLEIQAGDPAYARFFGELARTFRVVRYDRDGMGLSDRTPTDYSLESEVAGLEALVEHLGVERVHLLGGSCATPVVLAYAAKRPERTGKIVVCEGYLDGASLAPPEARRAFTALVRASWGLGSRVFTDLFMPGVDADTQQGFKRLQRASADGETAARLLDLMYEADATRFVADVRVPVLVLHRKGDRAMRHEEGRKLAAALPDATFVSLEGACHLPWHGDQDAVIAAVREFLGEGRVAPPPLRAAAGGAELRREGEVWTILFAGREARLKDSKGIADLARLLAAPGEELHVLELADVAPEARAALARGEPVLDRRALDACRRRLSDLDESIAAAESRGEAAAYGRLSREREELVRRLAADTGKGGRARRSNDSLERARKAVAARLRDAIQRIGAVHPALGEHLAAAVVTGVRCAYRPPAPVAWTVVPGPI